MKAKPTRNIRITISLWAGVFLDAGRPRESYDSGTLHLNANPLHGIKTTGRKAKSIGGWKATSTARIPTLEDLPRLVRELAALGGVTLHPGIRPRRDAFTIDTIPEGKRR